LSNPVLGKYLCLLSEGYDVVHFFVCAESMQGAFYEALRLEGIEKIDTSSPEGNYAEFLKLAGRRIRIFKVTEEDDGSQFDDFVTSLRGTGAEV